MNRVFLQVWELSDRKDGVCRDGCSLHVGDAQLKDYVQSVYSSRGTDVPEEYARALGNYLEAFVDDALYDIVVKDGSLKIPETSLTNLLNLGELIVK